MDEWAEQAGTAEPVKVYARLTQTAPLAEHVADAEGAADEGVDVDATGQDVAPGGGEVDRVPGCGELVEGWAAMRVRSNPARRPPPLGGS